MIALDTNVVVRLLVKDDAPQVDAALRVLATAGPVFLPNTVLLETVWVLQAVYDATRADIVSALDALLPLVTPEIPNAAQLVRWYRDGMDFADAFHLAVSAAARCDALYSFDRDFVKRAHARTSCKVLSPV